MSTDRVSDIEELAIRLGTLRPVGPRPLVVGISGFGGAGKSTLAGALGDQLTGAVVVPGDEFMRERPSAHRSDDWAAMDRGRLAAQVLRPVRAGEPARYQVFDWEAEALGPWVSLGSARVVIVEGLSLFHPDLVDLFDFRI